jgi:hypothetical protein
VNWAAVTPLAPPPLPVAAAMSFPGPAVLLPIYQAAAAQYDVPWQILVAINEIQTDYGARVRRSGAAGRGWMRFRSRAWRRWGLDGDGDRRRNPFAPVDAIFATARYLHHAGTLSRLDRILFTRRRGGELADLVTGRAQAIGSIDPDVLAALTEHGRRDDETLRRMTRSSRLIARRAKINGVGRAMLASDRRLRRRVLADPGIDIYPCGRADIAAGVVDRRVLVLLEYLASDGLRPSVSSLRCGHGYYTEAGTVSEHSYGDAVDISAVNGVSIAGHQGPRSITDRTIHALLELGGMMKPHQIISLMTYQGADNTLALEDHGDHIHVGFRPRRQISGPLPAWTPGRWVRSRPGARAARRRGSADELQAVVALQPPFEIWRFDPGEFELE